MAILQSSSKALKNQEMRLRNGELSRTSVDLWNTQLVTCTGRPRFSADKTECAFCTLTWFTCCSNTTGSPSKLRQRRTQWLLAGGTQLVRLMTRIQTQWTQDQCLMTTKRTTFVTLTSIKFAETSVWKLSTSTGGAETKTSESTSRCVRSTTSDQVPLASTTKRSTKTPPKLTQSSLPCATRDKQSDRICLLI